MRSEISEQPESFDKKPRRGIMSKAKGLFSKGKKKLWGRSKSSKSKDNEERALPADDIGEPREAVIPSSEEQPSTVTPLEESNPDDPESQSTKEKPKGFMSKAKGMFSWKAKSKGDSSTDIERTIPSSESKKPSSDAADNKKYLSKAKGMLSKVKKKTEVAVGLRDEAESPCFACCPKMTYKQRLYGFGISYGLGMVCSVLGIFILWFTMFQAVTTFAIFYTLGNLLALSSGIFLTGIKRQFKLIMSHGRWICILVYLGLMGFTIWYTVIRPNEYVNPKTKQKKEDNPSMIIILLLVIGQFLAGFWYMLSYIPYGRALAKKCLGKATDMD